MHKENNHWNDANTTALINGISGIAGNIIDDRNAGAYVSNQDAKLASLAEQTALALAQANQANQNPEPTWMQKNGVILSFAAVGIIIIILVLLKKR